MNRIHIICVGLMLTVAILAISSGPILVLASAAVAIAICTALVTATQPQAAAVSCPSAMHRVMLADSDNTDREITASRQRMSSREQQDDAFAAKPDAHRVPEPLEARQFLIETLAQGGQFTAKRDATLVPSPLEDPR